MKLRTFYVYILASRPKRGALYIGITNDLIRRVYEHKEKLTDGFTKQYQIDKLVYFEEHPTSEDAMTREKQLKRWNRQWKIELIESQNSDWTDLYDSLLG
ncbi:MAG: GIY-YIG nuclease family protein [Candidatus Saccharimonadales bacterium]